MKPFLTYEQQLHKLTDEKQLIINNREFAEEKLRDIGYFALIGGYKEPFRDAMTRVYLENTTFEDIYALYDFDECEKVDVCRGLVIGRRLEFFGICPETGVEV